MIIRAPGVCEPADANLLLETYLTTAFSLNFSLTRTINMILGVWEELFCFWVIPGGTQGSSLALCSVTLLIVFRGSSVIPGNEAGSTISRQVSYLL